MENYEIVMKRVAVESVLFNDVFSRFFHQLSNQGAVVLKEFDGNKPKMCSSIVDATMESLMQRTVHVIGEGVIDSIVSKSFDAIASSPWYVNFLKSNLVDDIPLMIDAIRTMVSTVVSCVDDKDVEKIDLESASPLLFNGHFEPMFMEVETPPAFIETKVKPTV